MQSKLISAARVAVVVDTEMANPARKILFMGLWMAVLTSESNQRWQEESPKLKFQKRLTPGKARDAPVDPDPFFNGLLSIEIDPSWPPCRVQRLSELMGEQDRQ
jgi:hypothetical protein